MKTARGIHHEGVAVNYLGGTKVEFICPFGHKSVRDYGKGPAHRRMARLE